MRFFHVQYAGGLPLAAGKVTIWGSVNGLHIRRGKRVETIAWPDVKGVRKGQWTEIVVNRNGVETAILFGDSDAGYRSVSAIVGNTELRNAAPWMPPAELPTTLILLVGLAVATVLCYVGLKAL